MRTIFGRYIAAVALICVLACPVFGQSSDPSKWPAEIIAGWIQLVDFQAERENVSGLINFEQACANWGLNYKAAQDSEAFEAAHPIPVPPNRAVRGEVQVAPAYGTYKIPFVVYADEPIAGPCEKPSRPIAPDGAYGFGPPVDPSQPLGNLLIRWPTTVPAGTVRQNTENGRNYRLVVKTYGSFTTKWWEPVG